MPGPSPAADTIRIYDVDLGIDCRLAPSFSRRTTISFGSGSSVIPTHEETFYQALGDVTLNHEIDRILSFQAVYRRQMQLVEGFAEPFLSDSLTSGIGGYLGRRVDLAAAARYTTGSVGLASDATGYDTSFGSLDFRVVLSRHLALQTQYLYYHYLFADRAPLPPGFAHAVDRQSLRVGLPWVASVLR